MLRATLALVAGFVIFLIAAWQSGSTGEICENAHTYNEYCTSYNLAPFILIQIYKALHSLEGVITALSTIAIAWFTLTLKKSTDKLWIETRDTAGAQRRDTEILQRAYIAVELGGIEAFVHGPFYACNVKIKNAGNLPARNVSWAIFRKFSDTETETDLRIDETKFEKKTVVPPKAIITMSGAQIGKSVFETAINKARGQAITTKSNQSWYYVWGEVRYNDGFPDSEIRSTWFCHRYNLAAARPQEGHFWIKAEDGRFHVHGNDAN